MKHHRTLLPALFVLIPLLGAALLVTNNFSPLAAATDPFRCADGAFYFPTGGVVGWKYMDPGSTDTDAEGNVTVHTGVDLYAEAGPGAPVYAPADGVVSREPGADNVNLLLPGVTDALTGVGGVELYITHLEHSLVADQPITAGEVIGYQLGDHVHVSVGAFPGYDDREIAQTQDPSPYFAAALSYAPENDERQPAEHWCFDGEPPASTANTPNTAEITVVRIEHVVVEGDTLSGIAETYGVTVEAIAAENGLEDVDYLSIGQVLVIPSESTSIAPSSPPENGSPPEPDPTPQSYVVVEGDTLSAIAEMFGTTVEAIVDLNGLSDPDFLNIGDTLQIPS